MFKPSEIPAVISWCVFLCFVAAGRAPAQDGGKYLKAKFTGYQSCASTSCHGGGSLHNESIFYDKNDVHRNASGILGKGTSQRIAEAIGIAGDPGRAAQCTVCHSPMEAVPAERLVKDVKPDRGVGCESCHGPAEPWLRFHTRRDVKFEQIVAAGLRDLNDLYGRANACVACHLNLDEPIRRAGHPELFFELDRQCMAQPPHYKDERPSLGPRSWLTGQAVALREMSWKLSAQRDERLAVRWKALVWLLRKTEAGRKELPEGEDFSAMQSGADRLARAAAQAIWSKNQIAAQTKDYLSLHAEFGDAKNDKTELRRRAEVLAPAIIRLWSALKTQGAADSSGAFEPALVVAAKLAKEQESFDPPAFAGQLAELQKAFERVSKP
jgi:hypothetical protein